MTDSTLDADDIDWAKGDGLVPAIVQHRVTGRVLMLGYMNRDSYLKTMETGLVTFFSRSRNQLWCKGETSGNTLACIAVSTDCDNDALLVMAEPAGPTCHLGKASCFDCPDDHRPAPFDSGFGFLGELRTTIESRKGADADSSYTASLFADGDARMAQKVGEEGVEVALAAVQDKRDELVEESADLLYHLSVLLASKGLSMTDVAEKLKSRSS